MPSITFAETLKATLDVRAIDRYFLEDTTGKTVDILQRLRPEGRVDGGRFKLASMEGGAGGSADYNLQNHKWGDWSNSNTARGWGIIGFIQTTLKCTKAQAVKWLLDEKFLQDRDAKKSLADVDGDPLVLPIPDAYQSWDYVLQQDFIKRDKALITHHWAYYDLDGQLLCYKYRVDQRNTAKEVYTLTYRAQKGWTKKALSKKHVPLYGLQKLRGSPTVRVLIVEGEKAADAAQKILGDRWKVLAFSGVSASQSTWIPDEKFWEDCEVILWPDNDQAGREAMRRIQLALEALKNKPREVRIVRIEDIPGLPPKWDLADWTPETPIDIKVELQRAEEVDSFERICREYVYVTQTDQFYNLIDKHLVYSPTAFDRRYSMFADRSGKPSVKFLSDRGTKKVDGIEFIPGEAEFIVSAQGKEFYNEWFPSGVYAKGRLLAADQTISDDELAENAVQFIQHVQRIAGGQVAEPDLDPATKQPIESTANRAISDAIYTYFHQIISRPMDKSGWVLTLLSQHNGTGKSYFKSMVESIFGGNRTTVVNVQQYVSQYHDWRDGVLFYELAEVKNHETANTYDEIKKNHNHRPFHFSASNDRMANTLKLNIKSRGMKAQRDFINGMVTANDLYPIVLGTGGDSGSDRRLFVVRCETTLSEQEANLLYGELETNAEWICAWLLRFKSKFKWNPGWAPVTEHKRLMFEKDRERSEARSDKTELGKYDEFYHFVVHANKEKIGGFTRKVITGENVREIVKAQHLRFPYDEARFDKIMDRAGFKRGPTLIIEGSPRACYTSNHEWLEKPEKEWLVELNRSINSI